MRSAGWASVQDGRRSTAAAAQSAGLSVLAEMVGPAGRAVGVDFQSVGDLARSVAALALESVELAVGDIHYLDPATLGGPFDLAFTRCFLVPQADPAQTLGQIAGFLRPGGWIVAHEPLPSPPPRSHPHLGALTTVWDLLYEVMEMAGAPRGIFEGLEPPARAAGLEVVEANGTFTTLCPELGFELHAATLAAARERAAKSGITAETIDDLVLNLRAAKRATTSGCYRRPFWTWRCASRRGDRRGRHDGVPCGGHHTASQAMEMSKDRQAGIAS